MLLIVRAFKRWLWSSSSSYRSLCFILHWLYTLVSEGLLCPLNIINPYNEISRWQVAKTYLHKNSGIGQSYWQVILGRTLTGCGASGIVSLASIIITGKECFVLDSSLFIFLVAKCHLYSQWIIVRHCRTLGCSGFQKLCQHRVDTWNLHWWTVWRISWRNSWLEMASNFSKDVQQLLLTFAGLF